MKKLLLWLVFTFFMIITHSQTLFTYGNHSVSSGEFLKAFNKNKTSEINFTKALRDYLNLYIDYKLKVQAASDMRLDTLPSLVADLQNFRSQIQGNYLIDEPTVNRLVYEAFNRGQKDIHTIYYFISAPEDMDSLKLSNTVKEIAGKLKDNKPEKEILSTINTSYQVKVEKNDAGFITVFSLPYEFENIIYTLKPGQVSIPYKTKKGWYVFKNVSERKAVGKISIAQILFAVPEGDELQKEKIRKLADSVYIALRNGSDFSMLAKQFSDDRTTFMNGGKVPEFGTASYDSVFENQAFNLKNDHDISPPFETKFGYHIIKRIAAMPVPSTTDDEAFMYNLKQEVLNDKRAEIAKQKFFKEIKPLIGYEKEYVNEENLWRVSDSSLLVNRNVTSGNVNEYTTLFYFNDHQKVKVRDWILYLRNSNKVVPGERHDSYTKIFSDFINASAATNYASRLENFNEGFKARIEEFKEGNMLFEIMTKKIWAKASEDTNALQQYYKSHIQNYFWNASAEAVIFSCSNGKMADNTIRQLENGKSWRQIMKDDPSHIQCDSGRFELEQLPVVDRKNFRSGFITKPEINKNDSTAVFIKILNLYTPHQPRDFQDSRGLVVSDYQNYLDEKWVEQLKKKYPVKVNEQAFKKLLNSKKF